jgi:YVTN family beta-propeller protein
VENTLQLCFSGAVEFALLGPLEVRVEGHPVGLGGPRQRAVLALLLLHANEVVSRDRLIEGLWGEQPPASAGRSLDSYVSRLRRLLGAERIERRAPGYVIHVHPDELDVQRFETLLDHGRAALAAGDPAPASDLLHEALALWRGPALADLLYEPFAGEESARLEERRLLALETRVDADLESGRSTDLDELERLVGEKPYRERLVGQLMLALYRAGRQSDALAAYRAARQRLADELGLEPSPHLRELERKILGHDPALAGPAPTRQARGHRRPRVIAAVGLAAVAAAVSAAILLTIGSAASGSSRVVELRQVSGGDAEELTDAPAAMAADRRSLWVAEPNAGAVVQVDRGSRRVVQRIPLGDSPGALAVGGGALWVASVPGDVVWRIDPATGGVTQRIPFGGARITALASGGGRIWVADATDRTLVGLDPRSGSVVRTHELLVEPTALAVGRNAIWVADYDASQVAEIDARTGAVLATVNVGNGPAAVAVGAGAVWVANSLDSTVSRIDPAAGTVAATIPVGSYPVALAVDGDSVWVANEYSSTVSRIDSGRNRIAETAGLDGGPATLVASGGRIWAGTRVLADRSGGTLTLLLSGRLSIDPAVNLSLGPFQADGFTRDTLVTTNHASGSDGLHVVPDLALALPTPTDGGRTYTFRLRPGIRYSNGEPLRARDFRRAFERLFRVRSHGRDYFRGIRGAAACTATKCDLSSGVVTDDGARTVTIHLTAPDPSFLGNLGIGALSSPVPAGAPWHAVATTPIPGTGPYRIAHASQHEIRYVRNPYFHEWSHAAQPNGNPDVIVMRFGLSPAEEVRAIERGAADWMADPIPAALLPEVTTRFAGQVHSTAGSDTEFLQLNTTLAPFDDLRVRRALNYAVDRAAVVRLFGGRFEASPACQVLPPGLSGYRRYCPYTRRPSAHGRWRAPDMALARRLVAASGTRGERVTLWGTPNDYAVQNGTVHYVVRLLRSLGYRASARVVRPSYFNAHPGVFRRIQLTPPGWADDRPSNFFATWLTCKASYNHRWFCDPAVDRGVRRAQTLEATDPRAAAALWARLDRLVTDEAAWVPLVNLRAIDFVSARVRNYQHNPVGGLIADQLVVR